MGNNSSKIRALQAKVEQLQADMLLLEKAKVLKRVLELEEEMENQTELSEKLEAFARVTSHELFPPPCRWPPAKPPSYVYL